MSELVGTLPTRLDGEMPHELWLGLLVKAPTPDGDGYVEVCGEGYARVPVRLLERNARHLGNPDVVRLRLADGSPPATHVALFDRDGVLRFYGRLMSPRCATAPSLTFEFAPERLSVIRLRAADAVGRLQPRARS